MANTLLARFTTTGTLLGAAIAILAVASQLADLLRPISMALIPSLADYVFPALLIAAFGLILRDLLLARPIRSRLVRPQALRLQRDSQEHLVGRSEEIERVIKLATGSPLLFIVGESGVGKSALLGAGVTPNLAAKGALLPIYIDSLSGPDWDEDAWRLLFLALQATLSDAARLELKLTGLPAPEQRKRALEKLQDATARTPLVIIDQFDDYQARHWARFQSEGSWTKCTEVIAQNSFWRGLSQLMEEGRLHLAIVTRSDTALGLETVRFREPETYDVPRLEKDFIGQLLDSIARSTDDAGVPAIENPDAGWTELRDKLIDDLGRTGAILPQQLKISLLGLAALPRQILTVGAYERAGRAAGLEAAWIAGRIRRAAETEGIAEDRILKALLALIDPDEPRKTRELLTAALAAEIGIGADDIRAFERMLMRLEDDEVVRRQRAPGKEQERWRLDHDYLAGVVREAHRRANLWTSRLREGQEALAVAGGHWLRRWNALLKPGAQLRFLKARLEGRFRYGAHRTFALQSTLRFAPALLLILGLWAGYLSIERGARFNAFVESVANPFDTNLQFDSSETKALLVLAAADHATADAVLQRFLSSETYIDRLSANRHAISRALQWPTDPSRGHRALERIIATLAGVAGDIEALVDVARLLDSVGDQLSAEQSSIAATHLIAGMDRERGNAERLRDLASALGGMGTRLPSGPAGEAAGRLIDAIEESPEFRDQLTLADSLGALRPGLTQRQGDALAQRLVDLMERNSADTNALFLYSRALGALGDRVPQARGRVAAGWLIRALERNGTDRDKLSRLGAGLGRLGRVVPDLEAAQGAQLLVAAMQRNANDLDGLNYLGRAVATFEDRVSEHRARAAEIVWEALERNAADLRLRINFSNVIVELEVALDPPRAARLASFMEPLIRSASDTEAGEKLSQVMSWMAPAERSQLAARILSRISPDSSSLMDMPQMIRAISGSVSADQAALLADRLIASLDRPDLDLMGFAEALGALSARMRPSNVESVTTRVERRLARSFEDSIVSELSQAIPDLIVRRNEERQLERLFTGLADPMAVGATSAILTRLGAIADRDLGSEQDAYRWLATEQQRGRFRAVSLQSIAARVRGLAETRLVDFLARQGRQRQGIAELGRFPAPGLASEGRARNRLAR